MVLLSFGEYSSGGTPDSSTNAIDVYGPMGGQHAAAPMEGNTTNFIAQNGGTRRKRKVSKRKGGNSCNMKGGKRRTRGKRGGKRSSKRKTRRH